MRLNTSWLILVMILVCLWTVGAADRVRQFPQVQNPGLITTVDWSTYPATNTLVLVGTNSITMNGISVLQPYPNIGTTLRISDIYSMVKATNFNVIITSGGDSDNNWPGINGTFDYVHDYIDGPLHITIWTNNTTLDKYIKLTQTGSINTWTLRDTGGFELCHATGAGTPSNVEYAVFVADDLTPDPAPAPTFKYLVGTNLLFDVGTNGNWNFYNHNLTGIKDIQMSGSTLYLDTNHISVINGNLIFSNGGTTNTVVVSPGTNSSAITVPGSNIIFRTDGNTNYIDLPPSIADAATNAQVRVAILETNTANLLKTDGSGAMAGNLNVGGYSITNVASITLTNDITFRASVINGSNSIMNTVGGTNYHITFGL